MKDLDDKIIRINPANIDEEKLKFAADLIKEGKLVVYPTDTVYGLGTDPMNVSAIKKIFEIKRRDEGKGLPILVSSIDALKNIAKINIQVEVLAKIYWPGPLTLILPKFKLLPLEVTGGQDNVAVRIPSNPIAHHLTELSNGLIIGTSANISGQKSPLNAEEANQQVGQFVDLIIDGGPSKLGVSSTIVDMTQDPPKIVRQGPIKISF